MNNDDNYRNWYTWFIVWGGMAGLAVLGLVWIIKELNTTTIILYGG